MAWFLSFLVFVFAFAFDLWTQQMYNTFQPPVVLKKRESTVNEKRNNELPCENAG
jgi:hypothetical protein